MSVTLSAVSSARLRGASGRPSGSLTVPPAHPGRLGEHGALRQRPDQALVDPQPALLPRAGPAVRRGQAGAAAVELGVGHVKVRGPRQHVDADQVPAAHQREGAARGGLRGHLPDHDALVDQAGQLAVGDHGHLPGEPGPVQGEDQLGRHAHARAAGGALATQDQHLARGHLAAAHRVQGLRGRVVHRGGPGEPQAPVVGHGQLDDPAAGRQAAADQHDRGPAPEGPADRADDLLVGDRDAGQVLPDGATGERHRAGVQQPLELLHHRPGARRRPRGPRSSARRWAGSRSAAARRRPAARTAGRRRRRARPRRRPPAGA